MVDSVPDLPLSFLQLSPLTLLLSHFFSSSSIDYLLLAIILGLAFSFCLLSSFMALYWSFDALRSRVWIVCASILLWSIEYFLSIYMSVFCTLSWFMYLSTASPVLACFILCSPLANISSDICFTMLISAANLTLFYSSISSVSSSISISSSMSSNRPSKPPLGADYFFSSACCYFFSFLALASSSDSSLFRLSATTFLRYSGSAEGLNANALLTNFELAPWAVLKML